MTIEQNLERIANALEALVGKSGNVVSAPVQPTEPASKAKKAPKAETAAPDLGAPAAPAAPTAAATAAPVSLDALIDALRVFVNKHGAPATKELFAEFGVNKISEVKPENMAEMLKRLKA